jgi:hypothetical protein
VCGYAVARAGVLRLPLLKKSKSIPKLPETKPYYFVIRIVLLAVADGCG